MPAHCCAFGCRTGYRNEQKQPGVTMHRLPVKKPELLNQWLQKMLRKDFTPNEYSRICSLHFADSDFEQCRADTNYRRSRNLSENLLHRRLKEDAVPRFFSGMPIYLTEESAGSRGLAITTSRVRAEQMKRRHEQAEAKFRGSEEEIKKSIIDVPCVC